MCSPADEATSHRTTNTLAGSAGRTWSSPKVTAAPTPPITIPTIGKNGAALRADPRSPPVQTSGTRSGVRKVRAAKNALMTRGSRRRGRSAGRPAPDVFRVSGRPETMSTTVSAAAAITWLQRPSRSR